MNKPVVVLDMSGSIDSLRSVWMDIIGCCLQHKIPVYGSHLPGTWKINDVEDARTRGFHHGGTCPSNILAGIQEPDDYHVIFFTDEFPWSPDEDRSVDEEKMTVVTIPQQYSDAIPGVGPVPAFTFIRFLAKLQGATKPERDPRDGDSSSML